MPLYEYQCEACGHRFERIVKFSDPPVEICPSCGGRVQKQISSPAFQFKGTGWYITDYAKKDGGAKDKNDKDKDNGEKKKDSKSEPADAPAKDTSSSKTDSSASSSDNSSSTSKPPVKASD
jgi:putative FmdB family regulatory protein